MVPREPPPSLQPTEYPRVASRPAKPASGRNRKRTEGSSKLHDPAPVAQGIERAPPEREVAGSIPAGRITQEAKARHATTIVGPGDVGFLTVEKGSGYGIEEAYSEVCWFYDLDATPSMPEGPIAVNVFARLYDADAFFAVCRRMRLDGAKTVEIARA